MAERFFLNPFFSLKSPKMDFFFPKIAPANTVYKNPPPDVFPASFLPPPPLVLAGAPPPLGRLSPLATAGNPADRRPGFGGALVAAAARCCILDAE
jgi:hypothetical protein